MFKLLSSAVVALATSGLVSAQTYTECNPLHKKCPANPAFGITVTSDLKKDLGPFKTLEGTHVTHGNDGAVCTIEKDLQAPTVRTDKYIFYGKVTVSVKPAKGVGIVTSITLQSDDLDEIDWEILGGDNARVQSNYFSKGNNETYDRGVFHPVTNAVDEFHTYSIELTSTFMAWSIDGKVVRTETPESVKHRGIPGAMPQTPMQVKLGIWIGGRQNGPAGTVAWAGGTVNFAEAPFVGYYKDITIVDYAGKSSAATGGIKQYEYSDMTGSSQSIKVIHGDNGGDGDKADKSDNGGGSSASKTSGSSESTASKTKSGDKSDSDSGTASSTSNQSASKGSETASGSESRQSTISSAAPTGSGQKGSSTGSTPASRSSNRPANPASTTTIPSSASPRGVVALGSILLAGAGIAVAQLL